MTRPAQARSQLHPPANLQKRGVKESFALVTRARNRPHFSVSILLEMVKIAVALVAVVASSVLANSLQITLDRVLSLLVQRSVNNDTHTIPLPDPVASLRPQTPRRSYNTTASARPAQENDDEQVKDMKPTPTPTHGPPAPTPTAPYVAAKAPKPTPLPVPDSRYLEQRVVLTPLVTPTARSPGAAVVTNDLMIDLSEKKVHGPTPAPYLYDYKSDGARLNDYNYDYEYRRQTNSGGGSVGVGGQGQKVFVSESRERVQKHIGPPPPMPGSRPVPPAMAVRETATPTPTS